MYIQEHLDLDCAASSTLGCHRVECLVEHGKEAEPAVECARWPPRDDQLSGELSAGEVDPDGELGMSERVWGLVACGVARRHGL